jgi:multidrug resistance efflux pump
VLVDENMRVRAGQLLVRFDRAPYRAIADQRRAQLGVAEASLPQAGAQVLALEAIARRKLWTRQDEMRQVNRQAAASQLKRFISPQQVVWPRVVQTLGTSMLFAPLNVAACMYLPRELRASAAGLDELLHNQGEVTR